MSQLAGLLETHRGEVLKRWTDAVREHLAPSGCSRSELEDHIPQYLREMVAALRGQKPESEISPISGRSNVAQAHGRQRSRLGFDVETLVREYGVLRGCIMDLIEESGCPVPLREVRVLTDFIATAIAEGVAEHTRLASVHKMDELEHQTRCARREADAYSAQLSALSVLFVQAPVAITLLRGPKYVVELANPSTCRLWGRTEAQILGKPLFEALPEVAGQGLEGPLEGVRATGEPHVGAELLVKVARAEGGGLENVYFTFVYQPMRDAGDRIDSILVVANDVTESVRARQRAEALTRELRTSEALLSTVMDAVPMRFAMVDREYRYRYVNRALEQWLERPREEVLGKTLAEIHGEPVFNGVRPLHDKVMQSGLPLTSEPTIDYQKHGRREMRLMAAPYRDTAGEVAGFVALIEDVTERKRTERAAAFLSAASVRLSRTLDYDTAITTVTQLAVPGFADWSFLDFRADDGTWTRAAVSHADASQEALAVRIRALPVGLRSESPPLREGATGQAVLLADFPQSPEGPLLGGAAHRSAVLDAAPRSAIIVPLFANNRQIGMMTFLVTAYSGRRYSEGDLATAKDFAQRCAMALDNAFLYRQAAEANRLKDEFLATVSHELRTPLTSMLGWVQMLKSGMLSAEKRERALNTVERNARAQAQLVEDLLDVSRIMSGKLSLEIEPVDVAGIVGAAVEIVRPAAEAKNILLQVAFDAAVSVMADARRLQQVAWNLLTNAVKFTPAGGRVQVLVEHLEASVEISVADTGHGISADFLPHVFERFRQADGGTTRRTGGLGLGLAIVRHLVEAHGGLVRASSDGEGTGATFTVRLPLSVSSRKQPPLSAAPHAGSVGKPLPSLPGLEGLHLLIVDDEEDTREYIRALLQGCQAKVTEAASAAEGLAALKQERPDVLLSDIGMPGEDGYALIRQVRALPEAEGGHTPAVALTAYARTEDRARAMLAGFQNHVTKPVEPVELLAVVASLGGKGARR